jgi:hypothetical protein
MNEKLHQKFADGLFEVVVCHKIAFTRTQKLAFISHMLMEKLFIFSESAWAR